MHDTIEPKNAATDATENQVTDSATDPARDELIDRYLNNQLGEPDRLAFEITMLEDTALFEQVQLCDALKQGLIAENGSGKLLQDTNDTPVSPSTNPNKNPPEANKASAAVVLPFRTWLRQPFSLAASVLVAAFGLQTLYTSYFMPADSTSMEVSTVLLLEGMRGNGVANYSGPGPYLFQIDVGPGNDAGSFAFSLYDTADQALVVQQTDLPASNGGWVRLVLDDTLAGEFTAELRWTDEAGNPASRQFPLHINN